ncbi:MAG: 2-oxoglutarate dehydrogenase complex dihydrolipoyllysine-residue succinyltransferase [Deinococcales bacterium]|nr:2-oxoglutarate dehydrogenase complex dihydrolipoyllysine-residue succinyltransferase [Chitinophagaceae bacterium]
MIDIKVPAVGESISEVTLLKWTKKEGSYVDRDEVIAELESEKATFEVNAEKAGTLKHLANEGDTILIGSVLAQIDDTAVKAQVAEVKPKEAKPQETSTIPQDNKPQETSTKPEPAQSVTNNPQPAIDFKATPVASAIIADKKVDTSAITPSGFGGKIMKHDVLDALNNPGKKAFAGTELFTRNVRVEKMSNLRKTISRRLVEAKNTTAMLTTFNEVDMTAIMNTRKLYKDKFKETHGVNLGFMSFFAKACAIALGEFPAVNAYIDGDNFQFHDYADISIAVSTPRGLTVPVIRNVESLSMAEIEKAVLQLAAKARDSKLTTEDLQGGTFTITNGGVFGSLMSTPIINIPQSAILGMHKIQDRAMVIDSKVEVRPMMYLALSYDHRAIDGRESVTFLVRVKELLEKPELLLIGKDPVTALLEL